MIPIIYESTETLFSNNGMGRLRDCISCRVTEGRNEVYECDFEYPVNGANFDKIQCGRIIGVIHDDTKTIQPFDIVSYSKPINGIVTFHAVHISYRLTGLTVSGTNINSLADALALLGTATPSSAFTYSADFTSSAYMAAADGTPRSVRQMLGGIEGSILDTYGGEYEFDKFNVILHRNRGTRKDVRIRYGVNMLDYNEDLDFSEAFTSCIPYWVGDDGNGGQTVIKGQRVDSGLIPYDGRERCVPLDLSSRFETAPTAADLEQKALNLMTSGNVNLPKQSIKVDFIRLQDFGEYEGFTNLLTCGLCDLIEVIFPDYNTSGSFKIVKTVYDVLNERFASMELGALSTTLAQALGITESLEAIRSGGGGAIPYGVCSASGGTVAKTVTVSPALEELTTGAVILVKFDNANTASNPTLNVNGTGAKRIYRYGTTAPGTAAYSSWNAGAVCMLIYNGSAWELEAWINTTYSSMTVAEYQAGTGTTARVITPARLKSAILYHAVPQTRTVNGKALSSDINLTASDVGIVTGSYVYNGEATTTITITDANVNGKTHVICGAQDAGNPPQRASISGSTITVYLASAVTVMRVNYICY